MQITRHWRLNSQRYRLEGVRYDNGDVSLQQRPTPVLVGESADKEEVEPQVELVREAAKVQKLAS